MGIYEAVRYNDEQKDVARWFKRLIQISVIFLISAFYSCEEVRYTVWGVKALATIKQQRPAPAVSKNSTTLICQFPDDTGKPFETKITVSTETAEGLVASGGSIPWVYIRGRPDENRPAAVRRILPLVVFLGMTAVMVGYVVMMYLDVKKEAARDRARARGH